MGNQAAFGMALASTCASPMRQENSHNMAFPAGGFSLALRDFNNTKAMTGERQA